ncbi:uncharacterized protein [Phyllobates terribilis]|uniref:uncharacterized protein n=1 Tax=Phyllobates terribilis TaxID=111132 RepID=UPI003CCAD8FF
MILLPHIEDKTEEMTRDHLETGDNLVILKDECCVGSVVALTTSSETVTLQVDHQPLEFLVDTGAATSVISSAQLPPSVSLSPDTLTCVGVEGQHISSPLTVPVSAGPFTGVLTRFLVSETCPVNLLGTNLLERMKAIITFGNYGMELLLRDPHSEQGTEDRCVLKAFPLMMMTIQPNSLWSSGPEDVGLLQVPPVRVHLKPGHRYPRLPQYPLKAAQEQHLGTQIASLLESGVLVRCVSPCNTPLFPVKKKTVPRESPRYRLVQDLRAVNAATILETPVVPNPNTLLSQLPPTATLFTVLDLANAFFSIPLHEDSWFLFVFTFQRAQNSPNQFTHSIKSILEPWVQENPQVTLLQYVDDLLLCGTEENLPEMSVSLLWFLHSANCKVSKGKVQWCLPKVIFLGHCISQGARHLTEERKQAIMDITFPTTYSAMQTFLGLITYCRQWIPDASKLMQPLYDCLKNEGSVWFHAEDPRVSHQHRLCFDRLKQAVVSAPALGLPDYTQPFHLFVSESEGHASGILAQRYDHKYRPLGYYSARLDPVARTAPTCLKAVHAAHILFDKSADIVLGHDLVIQAGHDLSAVLQQTSPKHLTNERHLRLQCSLLLPSNITFTRCLTINPATLLPPSRGEGEEGEGPLVEPHDCIKILQEETSAPENMVAHPLADPALHLWTDGSRFADPQGKFHTGYAVTIDLTVLKAEALPPYMSAQEAELVALTEACHLAAGTKAYIYIYRFQVWTWNLQ